METADLIWLPLWLLFLLVSWLDRRVYRPLAWLLVWRRYGNDPLDCIFGALRDGALW
jgi:hypothetical protein